MDREMEQEFESGPERRRAEEAIAELTAAMARELPAEGERLPPALAARLTAQGMATVRAARPESAPEGAVVPLAARRPWLPVWSGWLAAAAALVLWIAVPRAPRPAPAPAAPTAAALHATLLATDSAVTHLAWTAMSDSTAQGASGDVVWSDRTQRGVMRLAGLRPNDRARWQYQLWIFDAERDAKYPVDGGVFDVPADAGEVYVPIDPRLRVGKATMFAVTVERAGGVVVSSRERVALLAQREG